MFLFPQSVTPAVRSHLEAQTAFANALSKSLFRSFQQVCELNIQLAQTLLEEAALTGQQVLGAGRQSDLPGAVSSRAQPATEKLRAWQQHITRLAAEAQADLARVSEEHVQTTARTARAVVDDLARTSTEEAERGIRSQQEALRTMTDPFARPDGALQPQRDDGAQQRTGHGAETSSSQASQGHGSGTTH